MRHLLFLIAVAACASAVGARTWNVPDDAPTIAAGLDSAQAGDVVVLAVGTYSEHGLIMKRGVTLRGADDQADLVVIDGQQSGRILQLPTDVDLAPTRIEDLTFANADTCAFSCSGYAELFVEKCVFRDGVSQSSPPAMTIENHTAGTVVVRDCVFRDNHNTSIGGAVSVFASRDVFFERCLFLRNHSGVWGAAFCASYMIGDVVLDHCTITGNTGSGAWTAVILVGWGEIQVTGTLVAHNEVQFATTGSAHLGSIDWDCCDLYDNAGDDYTQPVWTFTDGNFSADPCFCDPDGGEFTLAADSWCLPGHHPWGCDQLVGAYGEGCAAIQCGGLVPVQTLSWSTVKALFR